MNTRELANTIHAMMVEYATSRVASEQSKKDKAEKELASTGNTKVTYDESVLNCNFIWSTDVLWIDTKTENRDDVVLAMTTLILENKVSRWFIDDKPMGCFYLSK